MLQVIDLKTPVEFKAPTAILFPVECMHVPRNGMLDRSMYIYLTFSYCQKCIKSVVSTSL